MKNAVVVTNLHKNICVTKQAVGVVRPLAVALSALMLTACSGGGSHDTMPAVISVGSAPEASANPTTSTPSNGNAAPANGIGANTGNNTGVNNTGTSTASTSNATNQDPWLKPSLGGAMQIIKRDLITQPSVSIDPAKLIALQQQNGTDGVQTLRQKLQQQYDTKNPRQAIKQSDDKYQFVKAGWVFSSLYTNEYDFKKDDAGKDISQIAQGDGYFYYQGSRPSVADTKGRVQYEGHWDFMTDAVRARDTHDSGVGRWILGGGTSYGMDERFGDDISATSFAEQSFGKTSPRQGDHVATFDVDFDAKKLTGKLSHHKQLTAKVDNVERKDIYTIDAQITGNRFTGSAKAVNKETKLNFFQKDATNKLEGGFYGDNADELLGKFISDDNSLFGVFAGKQKNPTQFAQKYDGIYIESTQDTDINEKNQAQLLDFANFGNTQQIYINGQAVDLLPVDGKKSAKQTLQLLTGQNANIVSFGTSDGAVRIGAISKSADPQLVQKKQAAAQQAQQAQAELVIEAKKQLEKTIAAQKTAFEKLLDNYLDPEDDAEQKKYKKQAIDLALASYTDEAKKTNAKTALEKLLQRYLDDDDAKIKEDIFKIFAGGEKFDLNNPQNWQAYLPKANTPQYTSAQIDEAKQKFKAELDEKKEQVQGELDGLVFALDDDERKEAKDSLVESVLQGFSDTNSAKTQLNALIATLEKAIIENPNSPENQEVRKHSAAIMNFYLKGDKNSDDIKNLSAYLPKPTATQTTATNNNLSIDDSLSGLFLLGERTPISQVPVHGQVSYAGAWHGKIGDYWQSEAGRGEYDGKASFNVDFDNKTLVGNLVEKRGLANNPAFTLNATISGNTFSGTATSRSEINLDAGQQQNQKIFPQTTSNNLKGAFFGENAKHLGGAFSFENNLKDDNSDKKVVGGVVFYGTQE